MDFGGRATNSFLFLFFLISNPVANDTHWNISSQKVFKTYSRWSWHTIFLHGWRSEGIIGRVVCDTIVVTF